MKSVLVQWRRQLGSQRQSVVGRGEGEGEGEWMGKLARLVAEREQQWTDNRYRSTLSTILDLRFPSEWFPQARAKTPRKIYCHVGPTNSGKTHAAIERLKTAGRGVYCAPLRLLAMEMWERLNGSGVECGLRTGEVAYGPQASPEKDYRSAAALSCTVEMLDLHQEYDVAIVDEIQMLADEQRGWAFTQALLGVNAREVYVCGEEAAVPLIRAISQEAGDEVEVVRYERLSPLVVLEKSLGGRLASLKPGDCVVAFSRNSIFKTKLEIERRHGSQCAVVYGSLPAENRTGQAKAFNAREGGCNVLVASDAIGMGLNL